MQAGIHPVFETLGRRPQKSKRGVSVAPQKWHVSKKFKEYLNEIEKTLQTNGTGSTNDIRDTEETFWENSKIQTWLQKVVSS